MAVRRTDRLNEEIRRELARIIPTVREPAVRNNFVSVTAVDCTPDLKYAKIYFSVIGDAEVCRSAAKALRAASGYIRSNLAKSMNLRLTPELTFVPDDSIKHGAHINDLLKTVEAELREKDEENEVGGDE